MSIGYVAGLAGTPLAQSMGSDADRRVQDAANSQRAINSELKAEAAAGVGQTDGEDHQTEQRDADGRRLWELPAEDQSSAETNTGDDDSTVDTENRPPDLRGIAGTTLDLLG